MSESNIAFGHAVKPDIMLLGNLIDQMPSNRLSNFGQCNDQFVAKLKEYLKLSDDREIVLCSSGHTALMAAYACVKYMQHPNSILMPAYTFESTRCAATLQKIKVDYLDVDPESGCLHPATVASLPFAADVKVVVAVCALSNIPDLEALQFAAHKRGYKFIIDGAASFGTPGIYNYGDFFCLSFHGTKTFPLGEGGAVICSKKDAGLIQSYINFGFNSDRIPISVGMNAKLSEITCAVGLAVFDNVLKEIDYKLALSEFYSQHLPELSYSTTVEDTVYQSFPIKLNSKEAAQKVRTKLLAAGIETKQYYLPLQDLPFTRDLYDRNVCLPCHSGVSTTAANRIVDIIKST